LRIFKRFPSENEVGFCYFIGLLERWSIGQKAKTGQEGRFW